MHDRLIATPDTRMDIAMYEAERAAWKSLAGYKFWMFGYHAAQWVLLNRVSQSKHPNPFYALVMAARQHLVLDPLPPSSQEGS